MQTSQKGHMVRKRDLSERFTEPLRDTPVWPQSAQMLTSFANVLLVDMI